MKNLDKARADLVSLDYHKTKHTRFNFAMFIYIDELEKQGNVCLQIIDYRLALRAIVEKSKRLNML